MALAARDAIRSANDLLDEDQRLAYDSALAFCRREFGPLTAEMDEKDVFPPGVWQKLASQGYLGMAVPEEYGGSGGDYMTAALVCQAMSRVSPAIALSFGAHLNLCVHNLMRNGSEMLKRRYLPGLCNGTLIGALAITEPNAGSDAMGILTTARPQDGGYVLNGAKMFITNGPIANFMIVYAKTTPDAGSRGITTFCLEVPAPGYDASRKLDKVGMRGSPTGEVTFHDTPVALDHMIGELDQGFKVVMSGLDLERAFLSFMAVGLIEECLALALSYSQEREQFGQPICNFQLIQAKLADMYVSGWTAQLAAREAIRLAQAGVRSSKEAAAALLYASEAAVRAADDAVQVHGGYGYIKEFAVQRFWRDARLSTIGAGTSEIRRLIIARELLGKR